MRNRVDLPAKQRIILIFGLFLLFGLFVTGRLFQLQILQYEKWVIKAVNQRRN